MNKPLMINRLCFLTLAIAFIISGCSTSPVISPYLNENSYLPSTLNIVEEHSNLEFKIANNNKYVYLSIIIRTDSLNRRYANSIINLWLNSDGLHSKDSGFQFPLIKKSHPFLKNQFSSLTNWGGFKDVLTTAQDSSLKERINDAENKILYFNKENSKIEPIESDGSRGFRLEKSISKNNIQLDFVIPLNAGTGDELGVSGSVKNNLAIGFEIMPNYNIFRSKTRPQQILTSPGLGRPLQQSGRASVLQQRSNTQKSVIYWLDISLSGKEN